MNLRCFVHNFRNFMIYVNLICYQVFDGNKDKADMKEEYDSLKRQTLQMTSPYYTQLMG